MCRKLRFLCCHVHLPKTPITKPVEERKSLFKTAPNDSDSVRKIFDHFKEKGMTDIGIITGTTAFGAAGRTQMKALSKEYGINILADETYNPGDTDMTSQLVKIKNANVKAIINWEIVPGQSIVPKNMKQLKIEIPLYQSHGFANVQNMPKRAKLRKALFFLPEESWRLTLCRMTILRKLFWQSTKRV